MVIAMLRQQSCLDAPGALQAVIICGIARKAIFKDDTVREEFMKRMH
jgi:hypothetical protein